MTIPTQNTAGTPVNQVPENKPSDKELNFRALEAKLAQERAARLEAEKARQEAERNAQEALRKRTMIDDDDDDNEPYVDHKRLEKKLGSFERRLEEKIEKKAEEKARMMLDKEKQESYLRSNPDFYEVLQHAEKFATQDPELAETILHMPEGFERQKLVYKTIKAMGIHKPAAQAPSIQEKIDSNKRSPYYQPSGIGTSPYANAGDFSPAGQQNAYAKMKELQARLRI